MNLLSNSLTGTLASLRPHNVDSKLYTHVHTRMHVHKHVHALALMYTDTHTLLREYTQLSLVHLHAQVGTGGDRRKKDGVPAREGSVPIRSRKQSLHLDPSQLGNN